MKKVAPDFKIVSHSNTFPKFEPENFTSFKKMRNNTKLKTLLQKYTLTFDRDEDEIFKLRLTDKNKGTIKEFEGPSYGDVLSKAYSYLLKVLKHPMEYE